MKVSYTPRLDYRYPPHGHWDSRDQRAYHSYCGEHGPLAEDSRPWGSQEPWWTEQHHERRYQSELSGNSYDEERRWDSQLPEIKYVWVCVYRFAFLFVVNFFGRINLSTRQKEFGTT